MNYILFDSDVRNALLPFTYTSAVFAINELLGKPFSKQELIYFAMQGEKLASGR